MNFVNLLATGLQTTMTLQDFFLMLLWISLIALIFMLVAILFKLYQTLKDLRLIVKENRQNINAILSDAPGITKSINEVTTEASHAVQVMRPSINNIADTTESVTKTLKDNNPVNEAIVSAYKTVNNVHKLVDSVNKKNKNSSVDINLKDNK